MGISRPAGFTAGDDLTGHVLGRFAGSERAELDGLLDAAVDRLEHVIDEGIIPAMNTYNGRGKTRV